jgi:hypothetical protein
LSDAYLPVGREYARLISCQEVRHCMAISYSKNRIKNEEVRMNYRLGIFDAFNFTWNN